MISVGHGATGGGTSPVRPRRRCIVSQLMRHCQTSHDNPLGKMYECVGADGHADEGCEDEGQGLAPSPGLAMPPEQQRCDHEADDGLERGGDLDGDERGDDRHGHQGGPKTRGGVHETGAQEGHEYDGHGHRVGSVLSPLNSLRNRYGSAPVVRMEALLGLTPRVGRSII